MNSSDITHSGRIRERAIQRLLSKNQLQNLLVLVAGEGFEPSKAEPGDLQAAR